MGSEMCIRDRYNTVCVSKTVDCLGWRTGNVLRPHPRVPGFEPTLCIYVFFYPRSFFNFFYYVFFFTTPGNLLVHIITRGRSQCAVGVRQCAVGVRPSGGELASQRVCDQLASASEQYLTTWRALASEASWRAVASQRVCITRYVLVGDN